MKKAEKTELRKIPAKNYLIAVAIVVIAVLVTLYAFNLYDLYQTDKLSKSYLISHKIINNEINSIQELDSVLSEAPSQYFLFISYSGSKDTYNLEVDMKQVIKDYNLQDYIYYFNVSELMKEDNYIDQISDALEVVIPKVPTILYYVDGEVVDYGIITREDENILTAGDFAKFLDQYEIDGSQ